MGMPERIEQTNNGMEIVVANTLKNINKAETTAEQCATGFSSTQALLENCDDIEQLKNIVGTILSNTQKLTNTSNDLKQELAQSSQEMLKLKAELDEVKQVARTDGLTGLLNRSAFNKELANLCHQGENHIALALFDLDHFKKINDTFGHLLGDKVLQFFSSILKKHSNNIHLAARYGGEEMAMIMMHINEKQAADLVEVIRVTLADSHLKKKGDNESIGQVTVSVGITMLQKGDSVSRVIDRADQALYQSKANGRNQINIL